MRRLVDLHCHYLAQDPGARENFRRLFERPEVERIAVCALDLKLDSSPDFPFMSTFATTNEQLAAFAAEMNTPKLVPWCHIDPLQPRPREQVEHWVRERGMRGIKMYPPSGWYPDDPRAMPVYEFAQEAGVPVLLHMGRVAAHPGLRSKYARPIHLEEVGLAFPRLKLLIGHFAGMWEQEAMHVALGFPSFRFDLATSGSWDVGLLRQVADNPHLGIRRLVLGTDGDGSDNLARAQEILERLGSAGFTEEELDRIACANGLEMLEG